MNALIRFAPLPFLALCLTGCPVYPGGDGPDVRRPIDTDAGPRDRPDANVEPDRCLVDGDCVVGNQCDDGTCVPSSFCSTDSECVDGHCDERGTCVDGEREACASNEHCAENEVCVAQTCRPEEDTCQYTYQCPAGRQCVNNACTPTCSDNDDCPGGLACESGFCVQPTDGCRLSSECNAGEHCIAGQCLSTCDAGCATGEICEDGLCQPDWRPTPFCEGPEDCAEDRLCVEGVCRTSCPTGTDEECMRFDFQLTSCGETDNLCYTSSEVLAECSRSEECPDGDRCIDALCR